jgi:hypothetical protein
MKLSDIAPGLSAVRGLSQAMSDNLLFITTSKW